VGSWLTPVIRHLEHFVLLEQHNFLGPALQQAVNVQLVIACLGLVSSEKPRRDGGYSFATENAIVAGLVPVLRRYLVRGGVITFGGGTNSRRS